MMLEKLGMPQGWATQCFCGIGYSREDELVLEQCASSPKGYIHMGEW